MENPTSLWMQKFKFFWTFYVQNNVIQWSLIWFWHLKGYLENKRTYLQSWDKELIAYNRQSTEHINQTEYVQCNCTMPLLLIIEQFGWVKWWNLSFLGFYSNLLTCVPFVEFSAFRLTRWLLEFWLESNPIENPIKITLPHTTLFFVNTITLHS